MNIYLPHPTKHRPATLGESWFFNAAHWKLVVMLGYSWKDDVWTKTGFSFMNIRFVNGSKCERITSFLDENGIKYSTEYSDAGWQYRIKISKAKKYLNIIDELYKKYYNNRKIECKDLYIYDNWFIDEQTYQEYKSYHKNDNWTLKKYI